MNALDPLIEGYLSYLRDVSRKAPRTVIDVRCTLRRAADAFAAQHPEVPLWKLTLEDYLRWFESGAPEQPIRGLAGEGCEPLAGTPRVRLAQRPRRAQRPRWVEPARSGEAARAERPDDRGGGAAGACLPPPHGSRAPRSADDPALVWLRPADRRACALDVADIVRERQELIVAKAKGDRPRVIPIPDGVYSELLGYLLEHGKRGALFRTAHLARRIRDNDVCEVVRASVVRAGLPTTVTARTLRHSFATHLMDRGVELAVIASLMGHRSPQETGVYLHVLPKRAAAAVRTLRLGRSP